MQLDAPAEEDAPYGQEMQTLELIAPSEVEYVPDMHRVQPFDATVLE